MADTEQGLLGLVTSELTSLEALRTALRFFEDSAVAQKLRLDEQEERLATLEERLHRLEAGPSLQPSSGP